MKVTKAKKKIVKNIVHLIPIIFIISIVPLITYAKIIKLPIDEANFWRGGTIHFDFSSYYKAIYLLAATMIALILFFTLYIRNEILVQKENKYYIPMAIYSILAVISALFSANKQVALIGFIELYQGIFVLLSYIVLMFLLINYTYNEKNIKLFTYAFTALIITEGLLGVGEYFGIDFLRSSFGTWLITPKSLQGISLKFTSAEHTIYGTLYNSNFVGSFGAMMLPLSMALYLSTSDKKKSILFGFSLLLAFSLWLGCNSRAGYLGMSSASAVGIIVFRKVIKAQYKKLIPMLSCFILITIIFNIFSNGRIFSQFNRLNPVTEADRIEGVQEQQQIRFEEVSVKDNTFTIKTNKEKLIGVVTDYKISFMDENRNILKTNSDEEGNITFTDIKYAYYSFHIPPENPAQINTVIYGRALDLYIDDSLNIKAISYNRKLEIPIEAPRMKIFDGRETFASNRGYIWSRTIPMLKNTIFIGYGPDNYIMMFPHEDFVGRFNVGNTGIDVIVDKPHNLYLQTAVNTGVLSLLALIFIWLVYLIDCLKLYLKGNISSFIEYIGAAIFLGITAYLVAGLFNDSIVAVAPLFWILLGMGIGINNILSQRIGKEG